MNNNLYFIRLILGRYIIFVIFFFIFICTNDDNVELRISCTLARNVDSPEENECAMQDVHIPQQ